MNPRQQRFVEEYLIDLNATQAYIRAGYSARGAKTAASKLLANADVQAAITEGRKRLSKKAEVTADRIIAELAKMAFSNMADYVRVADNGLAYVDLSTLTRDQSAAISEVITEENTVGSGDQQRDITKVKLKLVDKKGALELLGKHLALFTDRSLIDGGLTVRIIDACAEEEGE